MITPKRFLLLITLFICITLSLRTFPIIAIIGSHSIIDKLAEAIAVAIIGVGVSAVIPVWLVILFTIASECVLCSTFIGYITCGNISLAVTLFAFIFVFYNFKYSDHRAKAAALLTEGNNTGNMLRAVVPYLALLSFAEALTAACQTCKVDQKNKA